MLNQTNIDNNNNKYYTIQLLQHGTNAAVFWCWQKWGRVGRVSQSANKG
jgi:poly [ADP-ribose] polymerase